MTLIRLEALGIEKGKSMSPNIAAVLADGGGDWGHMGDWGGGWMWLWGPLMFVAVAAVILGLARLIYGAAPADRSDPNARARAILGERYAKGELNTNEYRERLDELS